MNIENLRDYCLSLPNVSEDLPFGPQTLVFRIAGKIFLLVSLDTDTLSFNVKCHPELAQELREKYPRIVMPGYHMNKKHWNTVEPGNAVPDQLVKEWIHHSYELIVSSLPKKTRASLS